jgi:hypothetical protein
MTSSHRVTPPFAVLRWLFLVCIPVLAHAAPAQETWMSVLLDGHKIGSMHTTRVVEGNRVVTSQRLQVEFERTGTKISLMESETDEETLDGTPLKFDSRTKASGVENFTRGEIRDGHRLEVHSRVGGADQTRTLEWPHGALLAEGLRLAELRAGLAPGTRYSSLAFQADNLEPIAIDSIVGESASVELPDGARMLTKIEQTIRLPDAPAKSVAWVDQDQTVAKLLMPIMGYELTMVACSKACAQAPNQSADILTHGIVAAPRALSAEERRRGVTLKVSASDGGDALQFAQTDEQTVISVGGSVTLRIEPIDPQRASVERKPDASDSRPNDWLQSDAPEIVALAREGAAGAKSAREQMQQLEGFVRRFIRTKDLSIGYASALEVARRPEGDCTEHAVLLAALGRALGIPTRVVDGVAYVDAYAGKQHVFVPHAWTQAFVDGHWQSFDAALAGFDAGHVVLSYGDGDPWRFFSAFNTLGRIRIDAVEAAAP